MTWIDLTLIQARWRCRETHKWHACLITKSAVAERPRLWDDRSFRRRYVRNFSDRARLVTVFGICRLRVSDKSPMHAQTFVRLQWPRARLCFDTVGRECGGPTARRSPLAVRRTILYSARAYEIWGCGRAQAWPRFYSSGTGSVFSASGRGGEGALCKREPDLDRSLSGGGPGS